VSGRNDNISKLSQSEEQRFGLPPAIRFWNAAPLGGMNQEDARTAIEDAEFFWLENMMVTGKSSLRTLYDKGAPIYTAPAGKTIVYFSWFNINSAADCAVFLSDGTAVDVSFPSGTVTPISDVAGTFYNGGQLPVCCQSGTQFLLIANNVAVNNYWIWDGMILYSPGSIGPYVIGDITAGGANYASVPTVTFFGGSGTGATATATIENGAVVNLTITNPGRGYVPGDAAGVAFSGGGTDSGAILQAVLTTSGVSGAVINDGGSGYTSAPIATFSAPDSGITAGGIPAVVNGAVVSINVNVPGTGYTSPPTITFTGGGGIGASASAILAISGVGAIDVSAPGHGYTSSPTVTITGGGGSGATAIATVANGVVTTITVTAPGAGYSSTPTVALSGGGGSGAAAVAALTVASVAAVEVISGGSGYLSTPAILFSGGAGGTGAAGTAVVINGAISSVTLTSGGSNYTSPPLVSVAGGSNNAAVATISLMPFGVSGTSIESFQSRVWISNPATFGPIYNGGVINVSAPESVTDFATADGGLLYTSSDRFLRTQYVAIHQSNGFLYPLADSSVDVISNVQTSGTPVTTTFNYQNTHAQIGVAWRDTVQDYGQSVLFANANGICGLYGGSVQKVSKKMDNLFDAAVTVANGGVTPSGAVANIFTIPVYLLNITVFDPLQGVNRTVMIAWDEKNWFIVSQTSVMTFINTQEVFSVMTAWGTDGRALYPLLQDPSASLASTIATKSVGGDRDYVIKEPLVVYFRATDKSAGQAGIEMTVNVQADGIAQQTGLLPQHLPHQDYPLPVQPSFLAPNYTQPVWAGRAASTAGTTFALKLTTSSPDFVISAIGVAYTETGVIFG
jgi:hypothetical protein